MAPSVRTTSPLRELGAALAAAAVGLVAALPARGPGDPVDLLVWLGLAAPACGWLARVLGARLVPFGVAAPGVWMVALVWVDVQSERDLASPLWAACTWTGLFAAGDGLARLARTPGGRGGWLGAGLLLVAGAALVALPGAGGLRPEPWPPRVARLALDGSPATWVVESAGVDWMRHPAVYEPVGTDRFERRPFRGALAGPLALLVGCGLAGAGALLDRRRAPQPG